MQPFGMRSSTTSGISWKLLAGLAEFFQPLGLFLKLSISDAANRRAHDKAFPSSIFVLLNPAVDHPSLLFVKVDGDGYKQRFTIGLRPVDYPLANSQVSPL